MNEKPWWLWEGAAVWYDDTIGQIVELVTDVHCMVLLAGEKEPKALAYVELDSINPAVTLAPEWATHVEIDAFGDMTWTETRWIEQDVDGWTRSHGCIWPQCPDHLKGRRWPLPEKSKG